MSRLLFPNQMKVDSSKKKPSADSPAAAGIIPVQPTSQPSPHPQSSAEASTNKPNQTKFNPVINQSMINRTVDMDTLYVIIECLCF